jgi:hypothetical protein
VINKEKLKTKLLSSTDFETNRNQERRTLRADEMRGDESMQTWRSAIDISVCAWAIEVVRDKLRSKKEMVEE